MRVPRVQFSVQRATSAVAILAIAMAGLASALSVPNKEDKEAAHNLAGTWAIPSGSVGRWP
jgi:hypothetical protein